MKVLLVTSLARGGPVEHAVVLARELVSAGASVSAICADEEVAGRFEDGGARPLAVPLRHLADARGGVRVQRIARGADVVHGQDRRSGLWTRVWPRARGRVRVYTAHGLPDPYLPPPVGSGQPGLRDRIAYAGLDAWLARRSDAVVVPSRFMAGELERRLGFPAERLVVIPNGIDPLPLETRGELVGTISMLEPVKALDVFLEAAAEVLRSRPGTRFAIFGDGSSRASLEALTRSLGIADAVDLPGHVPVHEALSRLRLYVLCSWLENCPMSLLEAMGAGVPSVATSVGGVPEIAEGVAELAPPGDPAALAQAMLRLLDDPQLAASRAQAGRERVADGFTGERNAKETLSLYERLLAGARR